MPIDTQLTTLFCVIDDFCADTYKHVEQHMLTCYKVKRVHKSQIGTSEVITLVLWFHLTGNQNFLSLLSKAISSKFTEL